jgi:hypothetical protein
MNQLESLFLYRSVVVWREERIQHNLEHLIDHFRKQVLDEGVWYPQVRIVVDFQQPNPEILIHQEIIPEQFEFFLLSTFSKIFLCKKAYTLTLMRVSIIISFILAIVASTIS